MKSLIKKLREAQIQINAYAKIAWDEDNVDDAFKLEEASEEAGDILYGLTTGNFNNKDIEKAKEIIKFWDID